jgi:hypothetical protein
MARRTVMKMKMRIKYIFSRGKSGFREVTTDASPSRDVTREVEPASTMVSLFCV